MDQKKYFSVHNIAITGILAAMIFALTKFISIPIPSPLGKTALSVGNAMCILASLLFGLVTCGLAAGIGNALVDLSDPAWAPEFWITFINKFMMAFVAGIIMKKADLKENIRIWVAGMLGALTYSFLYVVKNAIIAMVCAGVLYLALKRPLQKSHILRA